jgi:hypothetical protein
MGSISGAPEPVDSRRLKTPMSSALARRRATLEGSRSQHPKDAL